MHWTQTLRSLLTCTCTAILKPLLICDMYISDMLPFTLLLYLVSVTFDSTSARATGIGMIRTSIPCRWWQYWDNVTKSCVSCSRCNHREVNNTSTPLCKNECIQLLFLQASFTKLYWYSIFTCTLFLKQYQCF